jgi:glycogenin
MAVLKKMENLVIKRVRSLANPWENGQGNPSWTGSGYTKLYIWTLVEYELAFYIDADCLILSESVLDGFKHMLRSDSVVGAAPDVFPPDNFNAGVMIVRPSM